MEGWKLRVGVTAVEAVGGMKGVATAEEEEEEEVAAAAAA